MRNTAEVPLARKLGPVPQPATRYNEYARGTKDRHGRKKRPQAAGISLEISLFENWQLATSLGCELFRASLNQHN